MAVQFNHITDELKQFIADQKVFFVATATDTSRVNVSPKGMDSFRILDGNRVLWLNVTGSGNETAAHVQSHPRMTIMFCAFEGEPVILRLYGQATAVHQNDEEWDELATHFEPLLPGARQVFDVAVDLVQTSCGMAVPYFDYQGDRDDLKNWAEHQGEAKLQKYWLRKNQQSIDGQETHIAKRNIPDGE